MTWLFFVSYLYAWVCTSLQFYVEAPPVRVAMENAAHNLSPKFKSNKYKSNPMCFRVGGYIRESILEGIQRSRRTIVLLSQHFLDSEWCEFESEMSQNQLLQDPNFKMIVILMQKAEELKKIAR